MARVGVFYSVGFFIVMSAFLLFAVVVMKQYSSSSQRVSEDIGLEKIQTLDNSIQEAFRDYFFAKSGINIKVIGDDILYKEDLPNSASTNFKNNMTRFNNFLQSNFSVELNLSDINNNLSLYVKPHGIYFNHPSYGGNVLKSVYSSANFAGYDVTVYTNAVLNSASCQTIGTVTDPYLNVNAFGSTGSCSKTGITTLTLKDANAVTLAVINLRTFTKSLTITESQPITAEVQISNLDFNSDSTIITTAENVLRFNYADFNFKKNGTIRIV